MQNDPMALNQASNEAQKQAVTTPVKINLLSIADISRASGIGVRTLWRWVSSGRFPKRDLAVGRIRRWRVQTVDKWVDEHPGGGGDGCHSSD